MRGIDRGAHGDGLVGILNLWLLAEESFDGGLHGRDAGGAASHEDLLDVGLFHVLCGVVLAAAQHVFAGHLGLGNKVGNAGFELVAANFDGDRAMLAGDETNLDGRAGGEGVLVALDGQLVEVAVDGIELIARLGAELLADDLEQGVIEVLAAELLHAVLVEHRDIISVGFDEGDIEGASAEVID